MAEKLKSMPARTTRGTPWTTLLLTTLATTAFFRTEASRQLTFERGLVLHGEWWRLWTAHFVHFGASHLGWNLAVFVPAAAWAERLEPGRTRLFLALAPGIIGTVLLVLDPALARYAGLSGVAAGALALLQLRAGDGHRRFWWGVLALLTLKIIVETASRQPLLAALGTADAQPVPLAHLSGVACALALGGARTKAGKSDEQAAP